MFKTMLDRRYSYGFLGTEKKQNAAPFVVAAIIAPILTSLIVPLHDSYVAESLHRFQTPFLDIALENQALGILLNIFFIASPAFMFALVLSVSMVVLLKAPRQSRTIVAIIAAAISAVFLVYSTAIFIDPSLQRIGEFIYPYGSDFPLIACFVYVGLFIYAFLSCKEG